MAIKAGARFKPWFWKGLQLGVVFGAGFVHWLMYQSMFNIKALCPYCMVVWAVTIPLFVYVTRYNLQHKHIKNPLGDKLYQMKAYELVILWYIAIIGTILVTFWYYWQTVAPFSWLV